MNRKWIVIVLVGTALIMIIAGVVLCSAQPTIKTTNPMDIINLRLRTIVPLIGLMLIGLGITIFIPFILSLVIIAYKKRKINRERMIVIGTALALIIAAMLLIFVLIYIEFNEARLVLMPLVTWLKTSGVRLVVFSVVLLIPPIGIIILVLTNVEYETDVNKKILKSTSLKPKDRYIIKK